MVAKRKNFKKSLKEPDEFITLSSRILQHVIAHKHKVLSVSGGIVFLVLVVLLVGYFSEKSQKRALFRLSQIMTQYADPTSQDTTEIKEALQQLADNSGRYLGGKFAGLELANLYYKEGNYEQAVQCYGRAVKDFQGISPVGLLAKSALGYSLEAKGEYEKAIECFESVAANPESIMVDEALFTLGRLYAAKGNSEKQSEVSRRLMENYPNSFYLDLVKEQSAL